MRIVGGQHKKRKIIAPEGLSTRPTSDRTRESVFNILSQAPWVPDFSKWSVLDAFCGTGALGLESLSRGAESCTFTDISPKALAACKNNIATLGIEPQCRVLKINALRPPAARTSHNIIFLDPPYGKNMSSIALSALDKKGWLTPTCAVIMEMDKKRPEAVIDEWHIQDERIYGISMVRFLMRSS